MEVLLSGKTSFKYEVPYKLYDKGKQEAKPLILYLHGFGQNIEMFEKLTQPIQNVNAYHLFIQGPYIDLRTGQNGKPWGYSWYPYNGDQVNFAKSLEYTSEFIQEVVDGLLPHINVNKMLVFGYSMGGYQAGYFGLSRWKHVNDIIVVGCRIKTELFESGWEHRKHIRLLALHGLKDQSVKPEPQQKEIEFLKSKGLKVEFQGIPQKHKLTKEHFEYIMKWLKKTGYQIG
ncbi:MAG TPA: hypothetical protein VKA34_15625 [Balneolales bacterium]|nr:hypothetical protein [Balneolales bacterium]